MSSERLEEGLEVKLMRKDALFFPVCLSAMNVKREGRSMGETAADVDVDVEVKERDFVSRFS